MPTSQGMLSGPSRRCFRNRRPLLWTALVQRGMGIPGKPNVPSLQQWLLQVGGSAFRLRGCRRWNSPKNAFAVLLAQMLRDAVKTQVWMPVAVQEAKSVLEVIPRLS